jgi:flagellar hook-associated protein 3 FlgL
MLRITDSQQNDRLTAEIAAQRQRLALAQEQISTGKRINQPSDDPFGAAAVIEINTSKAALDQFSRSATAANNSLSVADGALNSYEQTLDHASSLLSQGITSFTSQDGRNAIATQLDSLRQTILNVANIQSQGEYVFGGTRQNVPPFDPTTQALAAGPTAAQLIQLEPGAAPITAGVTADSVFANANGTIFAALTAASAALRGTGNAAADQATLNTSLQQVSTFLQQSSVARTQLGSSLEAAQAASSRINGDSLSLQTSASNIESADFAKASTDLVTAQTSLQAILEAQAQSKGKSLLDLIG